MNYSRLENEILADIEWRVKELTSIKTLPLKRYLNKKEKKIVTKFAIPNIYSTWEGYVKFVFRTYINEINALNLSHSQLHNNVLSHSLDSKYPQFTTGIRNDFINKCSFFDDFFNNLLNPVAIEPKLPTESNINWKVLNKILQRFNLTLFPINPYKGILNDLLRIRNSVAHGENTIPISQTLIDAQVNHVTDLMDQLMFKVLEGCSNETYRKPSSI